MGIIYGKLGGEHDPEIGKYDKPIKMIIEKESNVWENKKGILENCFNQEKSNKFAETTLSEGGFFGFKAIKEGQRAPNLEKTSGFDKTIQHITYAGEFAITEEMIEDAKFGIASDTRRAAKEMTAGYYRLREKAVQQALINAVSASCNFADGTLDLTTGDGLSLFNKDHKYKSRSGTQTNYFKNGTSTTMTSATVLPLLLKKLSSKIRNYKDENGDCLGYVADTILLPCNRPELEDNILKVCGSERVTGNGNNDVNTQYGNWNVMVLNGWECSSDKFMVMSSDANRELYANMFYRRVDPTVTAEKDFHTGDYQWKLRARFGIGFNTWKHIAFFDDAETNAAATAIG